LVNTKASQLALNDTNTSLNIAYSNISALGDSINNGYTTLAASLALKASKAELDFTKATVASKASQSALDAITIIVDTKASQSELDDITTIVATKASQTSLNSISTSLNNNYNTLSSLLGTRASQTSVTSSLALKQDLIGDTLSIGSLNIFGTSDVAILKHDNGLA